MELTRRVVDRLAELLRERIERLRPLPLAEVARILEEEACSLWDRIPEEPSPLVSKGAETCTLRPRDEAGYLEWMRGELRRVADRLVDLAMEALAKHVDEMDADAYARLSWLLVGHASRTAHRLSKLAELLGKAPPQIVELAATLIALRAYALYRLVSKLPTRETEKLVEAIEAFIAGMEAEEEVLVERLGSGASLA